MTLTLKLNKLFGRLLVRPMIFLACQNVLTVLGKELGGGEVHEMRICPSEMKSDASRVPSLREADLETQPVVPQSTCATPFPSLSYPKSDIPHR
jgi:hypothetical protein